MNFSNFLNLLKSNYTDEECIYFIRNESLAYHSSAEQIGSKALLRMTSRSDRCRMMLALGVKFLKLAGDVLDGVGLDGN